MTIHPAAQAGRIAKAGELARARRQAAMLTGRRGPGQSSTGCVTLRPLMTATRPRSKCQNPSDAGQPDGLFRRGRISPAWGAVRGDG
jgi:hypothetical protein